MISPVIELPGLRLSSKPIMRSALQLFVRHPSIDFPDCLTAAYALATGDVVLSYDRDFDRLGVRRQEP